MYVSAHADMPESIDVRYERVRVDAFYSTPSAIWPI